MNPNARADIRVPHDEVGRRIAEVGAQPLQPAVVLAEGAMEAAVARLREGELVAPPNRNRKLDKKD